MGGDWKSMLYGSVQYSACDGATTVHPPPPTFILHTPSILMPRSAEVTSNPHTVNNNGSVTLIHLPNFRNPL